METQPVHKLRLMTFNIEQMRSHWPVRKRQLRRLLSTETPDLLALQEVLRPQGGGSSQADELGEGLGYRVFFSCGRHLRRPFPAELGNALLSRFPVREHRTEPLPGGGDRLKQQGDAAAPESPNLTASLLYALCSVRVGLLPIYATQLTAEPAAAAFRRNQLEHIVRYIAAEQQELPARVPPHIRILPPLLLGDLGAPPDSAEIRFLVEEAGFVDCASEVGSAAGRYVLLGSRATDHVRVGPAHLCWNAEEPGDALTARAGIVVEIDITPPV